MQDDEFSWRPDEDEIDLVFQRLDEKAKDDDLSRFLDETNEHIQVKPVEESLLPDEETRTVDEDEDDFGFLSVQLTSASTPTPPLPEAHQPEKTPFSQVAEQFFATRNLEDNASQSVATPIIAPMEVAPIRPTEEEEDADDFEMKLVGSTNGKGDATNVPLEDAMFLGDWYKERTSFQNTPDFPQEDQMIPMSSESPQADSFASLNSPPNWQGQATSTVPNFFQEEGKEQAEEPENWDKEEDRQSPMFFKVDHAQDSPPITQSSEPSQAPVTSVLQPPLPDPVLERYSQPSMMNLTDEGATRKLVMAMGGIIVFVILLVVFIMSIIVKK